MYFATRAATKLTLILKLLFQNSIIMSGNTDSWSCIVVHPGIQVKNVLTCMENRMRICGKKNHFQRTILFHRRLYIYTTILILVHPVQLIRYVLFISPRQSDRKFQKVDWQIKSVFWHISLIWLHWIKRAADIYYSG